MGKGKASNSKQVAIIYDRNPSTSKGQVHSTLKLPCQWYTITSSGGGVVADRWNADPTNGTYGVMDWSTRFSNCFEEYRVVKAEWQIMGVGILAASLGIAAFWVDEDQPAVNGTSIEAEQKTVVWMQSFCSTDPRVQYESIHWRNRDFSDASWVSTGTSAKPASLKVYGDNIIGIMPNTTKEFVVRMILTCEFRGLKAA